MTRGPTSTATLAAARSLEIDSKAIMLAGLAPKELLAESEQAYYEESNNAGGTSPMEESDFNIYRNILNR